VRIVAIDCHLVKQHIARTLQYDDMSMDAREILSKNLKKLMATHPRYNDRESVQNGCGVSARTIGHMREGKKNPTLANIEAVARLFKLEAWELLIDHGEARRRILERLLAQPGVSDEKMETHGFKKLPNHTK
jgi:transcriptional regulator with XRE-family HTH domain